MRLVIGNKNYSSWSMRAWVLMRAFGFEFEEVLVRLQEPGSAEEKLRYGPSGRVPVLIDGERRIWDTLAIAEYLNEQAPEKQLWPADPAARAEARSVSAEMHSGFEALRERLPMNCRRRTAVTDPGPETQADIDRICGLITSARERHGAHGAFLFGEFSVADAMYAPVLTRFQTYAITVPDAVMAYGVQLLSTPAVAEWTEAAAREPWTIASVDAAA